MDNIKPYTITQKWLKQEKHTNADWQQDFTTFISKGRALTLVAAELTPTMELTPLA
jgi:hypothetical protein